MKRVFFLLIIVFFLAACAPGLTRTGGEGTDPVIPRLTTETGWWIDTTGRTSEETLAVLKSESEAIDKMGFQLGGAIFSNSASDGIQVATQFGNTNGIGSADKNNGIAIVVFLDKKGVDGHAPAISYAVGSGLEGLLNDAKIGRFADETFVPARAQGQWEKGLVKFVQRIHAYLQNPTSEEFKDPPADYTWLWWVLIFLVIYLAIDGFFFKFAITLAFLEASVSGGGTRGGGGSLGGGGGFSGGGGSR